MFCCQGKLEGSTGASLAGRGMSFGAVPLMGATAIVSAEIVAGMSVWMAAASGREAALVLRNVRRLSMRSIMADGRISYEWIGNVWRGCTRGFQGGRGALVG